MNTCEVCGEQTDARICKECDLYFDKIIERGNAMVKAYKEVIDTPLADSFFQKYYYDI